MAAHTSSVSSGISAVVLPSADLDNAVLDLGAVLPGLVGARFEIIVVSKDAGVALELRKRLPELPLRVVDGVSSADGCNAAEFDLIFASAAHEQVIQLNHMLEAVERGADVVAGYRASTGDAIRRGLQRVGWPVSRDCASLLFRHKVWQQLKPHCVSELPAAARRGGYAVAEVRLPERRLTLGT